MIAAPASIDQALRQDRRAADSDRVVAEQRRQAMKMLVEDDRGHAAHEDRGADGDHDQRTGRCPARRLDGQPVQRNAEDDGDENGEQGGERQRNSGGRPEYGRHPAEHDKFTLGEVDDFDVLKIRVKPSATSA